MEILLPTAVFRERPGWSARSLWTMFGVNLSVEVFQWHTATQTALAGVSPSGVVCSNCGLQGCFPSRLCESRWEPWAVLRGGAVRGSSAGAARRVL